MNINDYEQNLSKTNPIYKRLRKKAFIYGWLYYLFCFLFFVFLVLEYIICCKRADDGISFGIVVLIPTILLTVLFGLKYYGYEKKSKIELYNLSWEQIECFLGCKHYQIKSLAK